MSITWIHSAPPGTTDVALAGQYPGFTPNVVDVKDRNDVSFAYGEFSLFREVCTAALGVYLRDLVGYGGYIPYGAAATDPQLTDLWLALVPFIDHSDSSGVLTGAECARLMAPLQHIIAAVTDPAMCGEFSCRVDIDLTDDMCADIVDKGGELIRLCQLATLDGYLEFS